MDENIFLESFRDESYGIRSRYASARQGEDLFFLGRARRRGMMADDLLVQYFEHGNSFDMSSRGEEEIAIFLGRDSPDGFLLDTDGPVISE